MTLFLSIVCIAGLFLGLIYTIAKLVFVFLYGEQIRQMIINIPEYKPSWFGSVGLDKPIKPWQVIRATFFVIRLFGVVFTKRTTVINEKFKSMLPRNIISYLKVLQFTLYLSGAMILIPSVFLCFQT